MEWCKRQLEVQRTESHAPTSLELDREVIAYRLFRGAGPARRPGSDVAQPMRRPFPARPGPPLKSDTSVATWVFPASAWASASGMRPS